MNLFFVQIEPDYTKLHRQCLSWFNELVEALHNGLIDVICEPI